MDDVRQRIIEAAQMFNLAPQTMLAIAKRESDFNPNARNPSSSAGGLFQFIDGTWADMVAKYGKVLGLPPEATRFDIKPAAMMAAALAVENKAVIKQLVGRDANEGEIYVAHFLGGGGAANLILANEKRPDAPAAALFPAAATANPSIFYDKQGQPRSVADVYKNLTALDGNVDAGGSAPTQQQQPAKEEPKAAATRDAPAAPTPVAVKPIDPAIQKIAPVKAAESEIERIASRVGAKRGLMG